MHPRFSPIALALFASLLLAACTAGGGNTHRASATYDQCHDPDWFGITACACGRCDRDGFDQRDRDRPDRDRPAHDPPPFAGKDT